MESSVHYLSCLDAPAKSSTGFYHHGSNEQSVANEGAIEFKRDSVSLTNLSLPRKRR